MHTSLKTKIGPFLVVFSVLAALTFLAAQHVQAHTSRLAAPGCGSLPTATGFFDSATESIADGDLSGTVTTERGSAAANSGNRNYRYAKITVPEIAAGELRVFDPTANTPSSASLCRGTTVTAERIYDGAHYGYISNAIAAARAALSALQSAIRATADTGDDTAADAVKTAVDAAAAANDPAAAATAAGQAVSAFAGLTGATSSEEAAIERYQGQAEAARDRANAARDKVNEHAPFQMRAQVSPGDEEYIVVVAPQNSATALTLNFAFHGAIVDTASAHTTLGGSLEAGGQDVYTINISAPGLLTVETTGSTDTSGRLSGTENAIDDSSGRGNNFKMVVPVLGGSDYMITVDGEEPTTTGDYTIDMEFKVAMGTATVSAGTAATIAAAPTWPASTGLGTTNSDDAVDTLELKSEYNNRVDEDYFLLTIAADNSGFLTVETSNVSGATRDADTTGTLYGPMGEIDTDLNSGAGNHFKTRTPVAEGIKYLVKVRGSDGAYQLDITLDAAEGDDLIMIPGTESGPDSLDCTDNAPGEICTPTSGQPLEVERYAFNIEASGALYLHTTGSIDTVGTLYGPDGSIIASDDNSGDGNNFRIAASVNPGLHLVEVRGKTRTTRGTYNLVSNFVTGAEVPTTPTTPGTGDEVADLQAEVERLRRELAACEAPVETDSRGELENPPGDGFRSGIGVISGWVCAASEVEVVITSNDRQGQNPVTLTVAQGTSRPDTVGQCRHDDPHTGFGMTYNFNHLREGEYTIQAYADDEEIGTEQTFTVVHLTDFALDDDDRFLRDEDLLGTECRVDSFPELGEATILEWEQSTQNFVIIDAGPVSQ